ncbi:DNA polymerase III epsilon subunit [Flavobacterium sp. phage 1/32]|nr:DNA polymerase III epsilon subunit [Flavobacterium sp. phage 1/32]
MVLQKPIVFFDLETTGTDVAKDKIVQLACVKINLDGSIEEKEILLNPTIEISKEASEVHGITNEMVKDKPLFSQISKALFAYFFGCDIGGYNSDSFDVPLLIEEFSRCGIDFPTWDLNFIDVLKHERLINTNKLGDVYKRYTGKEIENAHDALSDVRATIEVLRHQIKGREEEVSPESIDLFCQGDKKRFDIAGKAFYNLEGVVCWSFGKNINKPITNDRNYLDWVLNNDFPKETKEKLKNLIETKKAK